MKNQPFLGATKAWRGLRECEEGCGGHKEERGMHEGWSKEFKVLKVWELWSIDGEKSGTNARALAGRLLAGLWQAGQRKRLVLGHVGQR